MFTSTLIQKALEEDIGSGDITASSIIPENAMGSAFMVSKQEMVVAGLGVAGGVFSMVDPGLEIKQLVNDGRKIAKGTYVLSVKGNLRSLLMAERTALNFVQRLSGIATLTATYVEQVGNSHTKILDTRKTTPLLRHLEKYAVRMGGGTNHRMGLYDEMMIKDNHIAALGGNIREAVSQARNAHPDKFLVVEVTTKKQLEQILECPIDRVMLDNMTDEEIADCLTLTKNKMLVEVSGGITLERVRRLSELGVDYISVGAITHSVKAADLSLEFETLA